MILTSKSRKVASHLMVKYNKKLRERYKESVFRQVKVQCNFSTINSLEPHLGKIHRIMARAHRKNNHYRTLLPLSVEDPTEFL